MLFLSWKATIVIWICFSWLSCGVFFEKGGVFCWSVFLSIWFGQPHFVSGAKNANSQVLARGWPQVCGQCDGVWQRSMALATWSKWHFGGSKLKLKSMVIGTVFPLKPVHCLGMFYEICWLWVESTPWKFNYYSPNNIWFGRCISFQKMVISVVSYSKFRGCTTVGLEVYIMFVWRLAFF